MILFKLEHSDGSYLLLKSFCYAGHPPRQNRHGDDTQPDPSGSNPEPNVEGLARDYLNQTKRYRDGASANGGKTLPSLAIDEPISPKQSSYSLMRRASDWFGVHSFIGSQ